MYKLATISIISAFVLSACGGNDNAQSSNPPPSSQIKNKPALSVNDNSYKNFKEIGLIPISDAEQFGDARAYGYFSNNHQIDIFKATIGSPGTFSFWNKQSDGSYIANTTLLDTQEGCLHPRKALVADFNMDKKPDIFVACHGLDAPPFAGEKNKVILSKVNGNYTVQNASPDIGFFHSASAADLNGDTYPDVIAVNGGKEIITLINKKDGTFSKETSSRFPAFLNGKNYFTVELIDINEDGILDLLVGGHEWENAPTLAFINPGNNIFTDVKPIQIPSVANEGVVLDFAVSGSGKNRTLWVLRTSGGDGSFYASKVLQKVNLNDMTSTIVLNERPAEWVRWIIPAINLSGQKIISSDNSSDNFQIAY